MIINLVYQVLINPQTISEGTRFKDDLRRPIFYRK